MLKNIRLLVTVCLLAIAGVVLLQFYWIRNYYKVSLFNFEREINLAFEDAVKKDFSLRNDTIEKLLVTQLMDTTAFVIKSRFIQDIGKHSFYIYNAKDTSDFSSFSFNDMPGPLLAGDTAYKRKVVARYARNLRTDDLERHVVYYRIQSLGKFTLDKVQQYGFDTLRLRPVYEHYLHKRNVNTSFYFHFSEADSTLNNIDLPDSLRKRGVVLTKSFSTYKWWNQEERFVRAVFENPVGFVLAQMKWVLTGSLLLIVLVGCCVGLLLKALLQEKKLAILKDEFINNITHELKTPIATVTTVVEAMEETTVRADENKSSRYLQHARMALQQLTGWVDNILSISLYEKGVLKVVKEKIITETVIRNIIDNISLSAGKPVDYVLYNGAEVVQADKQLFTQAVSNILDNAIKYSPEKAVIAISWYAEGEYIAMEITDKGVGIPVADQPFVFHKFYRAAATQQQVKGHGLGLNFVEEIMRAHKGKVTLESDRKGTIVKLYWPLCI